MKKFLVILAIIFVGNFFEVAQAKIETFEGTGSYPITDEKTHGEVKNLAKKEAIRDALNKAGVAVFSKITVKNNILTEDVIKITAGNILKILSDKYNLIQLDENDGIGMYKATVVISIDSDELNLKLQDFFKREIEEQLKITKQYEDLQKFNDANTKRIAELEKQLAEKNAELDKQKILNEIAEIDKDTLYAQKIDEGWQAYDNKNFEKAVEIFTEAINLKSNEYDGYFGRGISYYFLKNYNQAISDYTQVIKLNPNLAVAYNNRGVAYADLQDYQTVKIDSNGIAHFYKNYTQAMADYNQAIKLDPNSAMAYNNRGYIYLELKNYTQAISDLNQAIKLNPNYALAYYNRGRAYYVRYNYSLAISNYTQAIKLNPNFENAYYFRGKCYQALGENADAEKDFAKARELGLNG